MEHLGKLNLQNMGQAMGQLFPLLGLITVIKQAMPAESREAVNHLRSVLRNLLDPFCFLTVTEFEGSLPNELYNDIHLYLESCKAYNKAKRVTMFRQPKSDNITMRLSNSDDAIVDTYKGMTVWWTHHVDTRERQYRSPYGGQSGPTTREFQLRVRKRDKARLLPEYLNFIAERSATYTSRSREVKIFTNPRNSHGFHQYTLSGSRRMWEEVFYQHPSTFETLAMEPSLKDSIMADLTAFTTDKAFYERTGRAWKRGYLLYGPPGTGKSSMIAAMANFLKYDIYDLELSQVRTNGKLRQLLLQTTNRSIIVLEDIDCSVKFTSSRSSKAKTSRSTMSMPGDVTGEDDSNKVTLSGLLNFVDGLWSCCGDERIFVFTTNHIEKLDKALLRPGRMDMQIELSYCTFPSFRVLAQNYLSVRDHPLFEKIEPAFVGKTLTPAQIAEILIKDKSDVDIALGNVLSALESNVPLEADTTTSADHDIKSRDSATVSDDDETPLKHDPGRMCNGSAKNASKEELISVLQGVIEALENNPEMLVSSCRQPAASSANVNGKA